MSRLSRRAFLEASGAITASAFGLTTIAGCGLVSAQPQLKRLGWLSDNRPGEPAYLLTAFRDGLREVGWVEGQNLSIDARWSDRQIDRSPALAAEVVALKPDVVVGVSIFTVRALMQASRTLPIVMADVLDPVGNGLAASLARPGGNVTGTTGTVDGGLGAKKFDLLNQIVPGLHRVAVVFDTGNPPGVKELSSIRELGRQSGIEVQAVALTSPDVLDAELRSAEAGRPDALIGAGSGLTNWHRSEIIAFANSHRLPSVGGVGTGRDWALAGGLFGYGPNIAQLYRRTGYFVDRILRGAKPADLPIEQPTAFEFVVNQATAQALGMSIPPDVARQVTEWVQ